MIWDDTGFLIYKNRYNENSLISEIYTQKHGKVSGIVFGGTSKKIKNYLQIGNQLHVNYNSKNVNRIGYFKLEIHQALSPLYFDDEKKLSCISSAMSLIRLLTAESQSNSSVYELIKNFYEILRLQYWIKNYIYWELELFKCLGFDLDFKSLVDKKDVNNQLIYISKSSSEKKIIPNFLVEKTQYSEKMTILLDGLKLVGDYLNKTILKPNNLTQPTSRKQFIDSLK